MGMKPPDQLPVAPTSTLLGHGAPTNLHAQIYADSLQQRIGHLESTQNAQINRHASMEADAQNLIVSLNTAIQSLESGQQQQTPDCDP